MLIVAAVLVAVAIVSGWSLLRGGISPRLGGARLRSAALLALAAAAAVPLLVGSSADAAIVATVPLATAGNYAVLGASTVTNTGPSVLNGSLGVWPGTAITGFPPGSVVPPATTDTANAAAQTAQTNLTHAYINARGRSVTATTTADLANLDLQAGVYAGPDKSPLGLTGPLTLDGGGNPKSVFIFQTDSTLITASSSTVSLTNGAQACNVFWQVGSSATLGTGSVFVGNVMALTSITVNSAVTVQGRALARNGAVTLDDDTFVKPSCATAVTTTTTTLPTTTTTAATTTTTAVGTTTTTGLVGATTTTAPDTTSTGPTATLAAGGATTTAGGGSGLTSQGGGSSGTAPPATATRVPFVPALTG